MPRSISFVFFSLSLEYSCNSYTHIYWKSLFVPWSSHKSWISNQAGVLHRFCPFRCSVNGFDIGEPPSSSSAQAVGLHSLLHPRACTRSSHSPVSFLMTCKAAAPDWQRTGWLFNRHTGSIQRRAEHPAKLLCPGNTMWKQCCQASKQQDHASQKLPSCRKPWRWAGPAGSGTVIHWKSYTPRKA